MNVRQTQAGMVLAAILSAAALVVRGDWPYDNIDKVDALPLESIVSGWQCAKPTKAHRVLMFSECFGYNHHGGRCYGDWTFARAGETSGAWQIFKEKDVAKLADADFLSGFDAVLLNNSSGVTEAMAPGLTDSLTSYVNGGGGIALIHSGLDAFKDSDRLLDMFGGYFRGHPWHGDGTWKLLNEAGAHPVNTSFRDCGVSFFKQDEIYQFPAFFSRKTCKVLISVDLSDPATRAAERWWGDKFGPGSTRADHDYAVSWVKKCGKGRIFYTSFGHDRNAFLDRDRLYHMFAGLQYVLGDIDEGTDKAIVRGPDIPSLKEDWSGGPYYEKMNKHARSLAGKSLDMVLFGDSITDGWNYRSDSKYSGGREAWEKRWRGLATANFGVSGDRTENVLWRILHSPQADGWKAKSIFLMIGINNLISARRGWDEPDAPAVAARGFRAVVAALREKHPEARLVCLGCLPTLLRDGAGVPEYNKLIAAACTELDAEFHDIGGRFEKDGKLNRDLTTDGLHLNGAGYEIMADAIESIRGAKEAKSAR